MALVGALLLCVLFGALLDRAWLSVPGAGSIERAGRALLFGFGGCGCVALLLDAAGVPVRSTTLLPALGFAGMLLARPALAAWRADRSHATRLRTPAAEAQASAGDGADGVAKLTRLQRVTHAGLLLFAALSLAQAIVSGLVRPAFQFDALTRWLFKAKVLAFEGTLTGALSTDPEFAFTHQRYPPLLPQVCNLPALLSGHWDERLAEGLCAWFAVALVAVTYGALRRRAGPLQAALGAAWIASLPLIQYLPFPPAGSGAFSAMADIPLALFVTAAGLALVDALEGVRDRAHLEVGLCLGFAALTKNEGLPLLAGAGLALLLGATRGRWRRALGVVGVAALVYMLAWGLVARGLPALDEHYPGQLNLAAVTAGLARLPTIAAGLGAELVSLQRWNLTWLAVIALLCLGRIARARRAVLILLGVQLASYVLAFMITAWTSPAAEAAASSGAADDTVSYLMSLTLGRLLLHVAPLAIALALLCTPRLAREPAPSG